MGAAGDVGVGSERKSRPLRLEHCESAFLDRGRRHLIGCTVALTLLSSEASIIPSPERVGGPWRDMPGTNDVLIKER